MILPITALILDPQSIKNYINIENLFGYNLDLESDTFFFYAITFVVFVYIFKNIFLIYFNWSQSNFVFKIQLELSKKMLAGYLKMPFSFFLKTNSSILIRNIVTEVNIL